MRKRVGVARAALNRPEVLLFDEPTSGLDPHNARAIHELVLRARARHGTTAVVITHDLASLPEFVDRVILLLDGRVHLDGPPDTLFTSRDPRVRSFIGATHHDREEALA